MKANPSLAAFCSKINRLRKFSLSLSLSLVLFMCGNVTSTQQLGTLRSTTWQAPIAGLYAATVWVDGMFYGSSILIAQ